MASLPSRERELKRIVVKYNLYLTASLPSRERELKLIVNEYVVRALSVAPLAGA